MSSPAVDPSLRFSQADFEQVRSLIYQRAGISLNAGKHAMVYSRLSRRLRETGQSTFTGYLQWLQASKGAAGEAEWQEFVNCLTTNLTSFFRESHHFVERHGLHGAHGAICASGAALPRPVRSRIRSR